MTYPFSGERIDILAVGMASAQGVNFLTMDEPGRAYLRRCANAALYTLGGEGSGRMAGAAHLRDALKALADAVDAALGDPAFQRMSDELAEGLAAAGAQVRLMSGAMFKEFQDMQREVRNAAAPGAKPSEPDAEEEEAI